MASSIPPAERRVEFWTKVFVLISAMAGGIYAGWIRLGDVATDEDIKVHDGNALSHDDLRKILEAHSVRHQELRALLEEDRRITVDLGEHLVSLVAADREPRAAFKALAATFYRSEYMKLIRRGYKVDEAQERALEAPWPGRPRW